MIVLILPDISEQSEEFTRTWAYLQNLPDVKVQKHVVKGKAQQLTEIYLLGDTSKLSKDEIEGLPAVERVVRISDEYRILGRPKDERRSIGFTYNGVLFDQENLNVFAGLCAVDNRENVETMMKALRENGQLCTRMGAYKPRTNPYSFQGHGKECLPYVFELAGKYGIKIISMEVTHESHVEEIDKCLEETGRPTGVMLQIGTRNTQNFELLKAVGRQSEYPVLLKRGYGITISDSIRMGGEIAARVVEQLQ